MDKMNEDINLELHAGCGKKVLMFLVIVTMGLLAIPLLWI